VIALAGGAEWVGGLHPLHPLLALVVLGLAVRVARRRPSPARSPESGRR
jgi:hypothetical protein